MRKTKSGMFEVIKKACAITLASIVAVVALPVFGASANAKAINIDINGASDSGQLDLVVGDSYDVELVFKNTTGDVVNFDNAGGIGVSPGETQSVNLMGMVDVAEEMPGEYTFTLADGSKWKYTYTISVTEPAKEEPSSEEPAKEEPAKEPEKKEVIVPAAPVAEPVFVPAPSAEEIRRKEVDAKIEEYLKEATDPVNRTVGTNKSSVNGFFHATKVNGVAIQPSAADSSSFVKVTDTDKKKSTEAMSVAEAEAVKLGATVGPCINVTYGKFVDGKYTPSTDSSAGQMWIGLPGNFKEDGAKYAVIAVYEGGATKVLNNIVSDANPAGSGKVLVNAPAALSANVMYAVIKY